MYKLCVLHINLKVFVEEKTEVGKYDPQLLPTIRVLELALKISTELVLSTQQTVNAAQQLCRPIHCHSLRTFDIKCHHRNLPNKWSP